MANLINGFPTHLSPSLSSFLSPLLGPCSRTHPNELNRLDFRKSISNFLNAIRPTGALTNMPPRLTHTFIPLSLNDMNMIRWRACVWEVDDTYLDLPWRNQIKLEIEFLWVFCRYFFVCCFTTVGIQSKKISKHFPATANLSKNGHRTTGRVLCASIWDLSVCYFRTPLNDNIDSWDWHSWMQAKTNEKVSCSVYCSRH